MKYTKEILETAVKESFSIADVMRKLGVKFTGGSHSHLSRKVQEYNIDISHFDRYRNVGRNSTLRQKSWNNVLILRKNGRRQEAYLLRRVMIEYGFPYKCSSCGIKPEWNGKELRLQVDHKSRNWLDDRPENVRFLCPNCHSQTEGYNGSRGLTGLTKQGYVSKITENPLWRHKDRVNFRKVLRPSKEILESEIKTTSFLSLSKKYGVSDNAIRKWCKRYGLEWRKHGTVDQEQESPVLEAG